VDGATVRAVARRAGVDPAMVRHWFGSREGLLAAVVEIPVDPARLLAALLDGPREELGARLVRTFLGVWDGHPEQMTALVRSVTVNERWAEVVRGFLTRAVLGPLVGHLGVDRADLRAALCASQLMGLALVRLVLRLEPVARADRETLVATVGPTLQRYLTGPLDGS
jgi:AcrR family transcriptional regulator